ncbi:MAG TPA: hypothetical protein VGN20_23905 [Mucilaginibacter sp.]|jgi:hypothetical protein
MKTAAILLIVVSGSFLGTNYPKSTNKSLSNSDNCLSITIAEKILGQPARLTENSVEEKEEATRYRCTYTAVTKDTVENNKGHLYFLKEQYKTLGYAKKTYANMLISNRNSGLRELSNMGDEAFSHTDGKNFYLMIVRKKSEIIRMKVNKLTSTTSVSELQKVVAKMANN